MQPRLRNGVVARAGSGYAIISTILGRGVIVQLPWGHNRSKRRSGLRLSATSASERIRQFSCGCQTPGRTSLPQSHRKRRTGCWLRVRRFPFMQRGILSRTPPPSHQQRKNHLRQRTRVPGQRNSQPVMLGLTEVRRVVLHSQMCTLVPIVEKRPGEGSPSADEWRLISGERQLFRIPVDQISSKHRTRSERRSPSGTRSDHRSPPRRRDDHRQPSVRSESKRGRSSLPRQRHGNSPTRQRQRKQSRHHRGHGPSHNLELSSRLSDRPGTCDPRRGDYTALKLRHNPVGAHQEQSERPRRTPRSATTTHPRDETPTARLVELSSGGSMKIHVDPVHSVDVRRQPVYHPQHYQVQHRHRIPDAFDVCCHYFQLLIEVGLHRGVHPPEAFACAQPEPGYEVDLKSAVLVFNDPVMFPSQEEIRRLRDLGYCIVLRGEAEGACHSSSSRLPGQPPIDAASCSTRRNWCRSHRPLWGVGEADVWRCSSFPVHAQGTAEIEGAFGEMPRNVRPGPEWSFRRPSYHTPYTRPRDTVGPFYLCHGWPSSRREVARVLSSDVFWFQQESRHIRRVPEGCLEKNGWVPHPLGNVLSIHQVWEPETIHSSSTWDDRWSCGQNTGSHLGRGLGQRYS